MDIFSAFATDPKLENEGRWVRIGGTDEKKAEILVARLGNRKYNRVSAAQYEANKTLLEGKDKDAAMKKMEDMQVHAFATSVLLDWKNIEYKGETPKYSYETAAQMLAHADFRELVAKEANKFEAYKVEQDEADAKN
jgi:hypothetical protein